MRRNLRRRHRSHEQLQVCKQYPAGTVNPPAVKIVMDVENQQSARTPQSNVEFTIQPNSCIQIWQNGELFGPEADTVYVTEQVPAGYTASSQITTIKRDGPRGPGETFTTTVLPSTTATTVKGYIGGYEIPGMLIVFTNTFTPPPPPAPSCTFTQGYWKNHEDDVAGAVLPDRPVDEGRPPCERHDVGRTDEHRAEGWQFVSAAGAISGSPRR